VDADGLYALLTSYEGRGRGQLIVAWGSSSRTLKAGGLHGQSLAITRGLRAVSDA